MEAENSDLLFACGDDTDGREDQAAPIFYFDL